MGQTEITIFILLSSVVLLLFICGIFLFIRQYQKRKLSHENEKVQLNEQHRIELLKAQLESQQQTMQFIGREIHDSVAQKLTLASIYTQKLEYENEYPALTEKLKIISNVINDSLLELKSLSKTLADNKMHSAALSDLLMVECDRVNETGYCRAEQECNFNGSMSVTVKSFVLRIIQEFIQNSLKHAEGKMIRVAIKKNTEGLLVTASDDGKGFDPAILESKGLGLSNMKRRADLIGGTFVLQSAPGKGTNISITIPDKNLMIN